MSLITRLSELRADIRLELNDILCGNEDFYYHRNGLTMAMKPYSVVRAMAICTPDINFVRSA
jgi:hypothetical protein